eukprot:TRINITY_DN24829_c0_g1_i1.p1 TRINITY_DN24829_c0_g1~~TRINITY_DN24829_c0_g1_i1.p1  ORF type:complete len:307 (+),score=65.23 TRINITY_DN24829_c0_g1_i1:91-1011(+)
MCSRIFCCTCCCQTRTASSMGFSSDDDDYESSTASSIADSADEPEAEPDEEEHRRQGHDAEQMSLSSVRTIYYSEDTHTPIIVEPVKLPPKAGLLQSNAWQATSMVATGGSPLSMRHFGSWGHSGDGGAPARISSTLLGRRGVALAPTVPWRTEMVPSSPSVAGTQSLSPVSLPMTRITSNPELGIQEKERGSRLEQELGACQQAVRELEADARRLMLDRISAPDKWAAVRSQCLALSCRLDTLSADSMEAATSKAVPGAMHVFEGAMSTIERLGEIVSECDEAVGGPGAWPLPRTEGLVDRTAAA